MVSYDLTVEKKLEQANNIKALAESSQRLEQSSKNLEKLTDKLNTRTNILIGVTVVLAAIASADVIARVVFHL
jgi:hypothetical protein